MKLNYKNFFKGSFIFYLKRKIKFIKYKTARMNKTTNKCLLDLDEIEAKNFFLQNKSYCNIDLPEYFDFFKILTKLKFYDNEKIKSFVNFNLAKNLNGVNFKFLINKDGKNAWREFQLIHPVFYIFIVNKITEKDNWNYLITLLKDRENKISKQIKCCSIPINSKNRKKDIISNWWNNVEQESIKNSLNYRYIYTTDISNCYPSIYTHSIAWAIHGIDFCKQKRDEKCIGNFLDQHFQKMSYNQTNGIPQGNVLSDFIAEIILSDCDEKLYDKLQKENIVDYFILRYRDDYKIFTNKKEDGEKIIKILTEILYIYNFKLNDKKTNFSEDIIKSSIKQEKYDWLINNKYYENKTIQKKLLVIYEFSKKFQNTNILGKLLSNLYENNIYNKNIRYENIEVLISIISEITFNNPCVYYIASTVLIYLVKKIKDKNKQVTIMNNINKKFSNIQNNILVDLFIQRIFKVGLEFEDCNCYNNCNKLSKIVCKTLYNLKNNESKIEIKNNLWNNDWIN